MSPTITSMSAAARIGEFHTGTGAAGVLVDKRGQQPYVHRGVECDLATRSKVGIYPNEKMARAAIPGVKACKSCR